jgi:photosystem II stability/assembly factor-like uncharacterized protein
MQSVAVNQILHRFSLLLTTLCCLLSIAAAQFPTITSFTPTSGPIGTTAVTIFKRLDAPAALQNFTATALNGKVRLQWRKNTGPDFLRYRIYRGTAANPTAKVDSTIGGISDTSKLMTSLVNGTTYHFRVTAVDNAGNMSSYSNEVSASPTGSAGIEWQQMSGPTSGIFALATNAAGEVFAGSFGGNVYRSTDDGNTWTQLNTVFTTSSVSALAVSPSGFIFSGTDGAGIFRSTDNGANWARVNTGLTNLTIGSFAFTSSGTIFVSSAAGIFRSTDNGGSWSPTGLTNGGVLAINSSGTLFAGTGIGVYRSTDDGTAWTQIGLSNVSIYSILISPSDHIFVGSGGTNGISRSTDNGNTWSDVNAGLSVASGYSALVMNSKGEIFAGCRGCGISRSTNNGDSWTAINSGLTQTYIYALAINSHAFVFAGTWPGGSTPGLFRTVNPTVDLPPSAPQSLTATALNGKVRLQWRKNSEPDFLRYRIYRGTAANPTAKVDSTIGGISDTSKLMTSLVNGTTYHFRVTAVDSAGNVSDYSNNASATPTVVSLHVATTGNDANPGTPSQPLLNIQTALTQAGPGDTIKVAGGTYNGALTTSKQVILWGGYASGFSEAQRDIFLNKTILRFTSGNQLTDANSSTIDGFVFDGTGAPSNSHGMSVTAGYSVVTHNVFTNYGASGTQALNIASSAGAIVKNNTFVGNTLTGGGVLVVGIRIRANADPATVVQNNIVTRGNYGILNEYNASVANYNCVYDNSYRDYDGVATGPSANDVNLSPKLVYPAGGDYRLKGGSPCIDAGNPSDPVGDEPSPNGGRINIGSYGGTKNATRTGFNPTTYVSTNGSNSNDGSISSPYLTIQHALQRALGDTIKVASGNYAETIITTSQGVLLGGYSDSFVESERNIHQYRTTLEAVNTVIVIDSYGLRIDGFFFDGKTTVANTALDLRKPTTITHCVLMNVRLTSFTGAVTSEAPVRLINNTFYNNYYAMWLESGAVGSEIKNNIITHSNYGFYNNAANGLTSYNLFFNNSSGNYSSGAIYKDPGIGEITANPLYRSTASLDFRLQNTSPAINAGDPDPQYNDPDGTRNDMGAFYNNIPPAAPQSLSATAGNGQVTLSWRKNTEADFLRYRIYRGTTTGPTSQVDSTTGGAGDTTKTFTGLTNGQVYYFRVTAVDNAGNVSGFSNEVSATPFGIPTITDFNPKSGPVGTTVTITGTNFNTTPANNIVYFGPVRAAVNSATSTTLNVTTPVGATYAPISVTDITTGLTAYSSAPFVVTFPSSRVIDANSFATKVDFSTGSDPRSVAIGDVDGDGKPDLVVVTNTVSVFRNTGTSGSISFAAKVDFTTGSDPRSVAIGDVNGDGKPDLAVANTTSNTVSVFRNTSTSGTVSFAEKVDFAAVYQPWSVAIGDLDGDGKPDLAVVNTSSGLTVSVYRNTSASGTISFAEKVDFTTEGSPNYVAIGDLDGDGKPDLAVAMDGIRTVSFFRNASTNGTISFPSKVDYTAGASAPFVPQNIAIGDLDGDGKPDLAMANAFNSVSVLRNTSTSGTISFATRVDSTAGAGIRSVAIADLDGDGKPDLASANVSESSVSILRNMSTSGTISFATKVDFAGGFSPHSIAIADLDGDGKPDLAVTNSGGNAFSILRNTVAPPSPPAPTLVSPSNGATDQPTTLTLKWNRSANTDTYRVQVATDSGFTNLFANDSTVTDTSKTIAGLANLTTYYWRVNAKNAGGTSAFSSRFSFTTVAPPALLGEYSPDANTVLLLHMNETSGSTVSDASSFGNNGTATGTTIVDGRFGNARSFNGGSDIITTEGPVLSASSPTFSIEGWVRLNNYPSSSTGEIFQNASSLETFFSIKTTGKLLFAVRGSDGTFRFDSSSAAIKLVEWNHVAASYDHSTYTISAYINGRKVIARSFAPFTPSSTVTGGATIGNGTPANFPLIGDLDEVRVSNIVRSPQEFNLQLPPENLSANAVTTTIELSWQNGGGAVPLMRYKIYRGSDSTNVTLIDSTVSTSYPNAGLSPATTYYYRIAAVDSTGFEGAKSYAASAVTGTGGTPPSAPTASAATSITTTSFTANWGSVSGATGYRLDVSTSNTFSTFISGYQDLDVGNVTTRSVTSLSSGTTYYYRVRAYSGGGTSSNSGTTTVTTVPSAPTANAATSVSTTGFTANWSSATGATGYRLDVSTSNTFATFVTGYQDVDVGNVTSRNVSSLSAGTTYYYRVRAYGTGGTSASSSTVTVATVPSAPTANAATSVTSSSFVSNWSSTLGATGYRLDVSTSNTFASYVSGYQDLDVGNVTSRSVTDLTAATTYYYRVRSSNSGGTSANSATVSVTTLAVDVTAPSAPTSVQITPSGWSRTNSFAITWSASDPSGITNVWYTINSVPSQSNQGTSVAISSNSLTLPMPAVGISTVYFYLQDGAGNKNPSNYATAVAKFDTVRPAITHNSAGVGKVIVQDGAVQGSPPSIVASASKPAGLSGVLTMQLYYRKTSGSFGPPVSYSVFTNGSLQIPGSTFVTNSVANGVDYRIVATDSAGNSFSTPIYSIEVENRTPVSSPPTILPPANSLPEVDLQKAYRLFSVPYELDDKRPSGFIPGSLGSHDKNGKNYVNWRMMRLNASGGSEDYETFKNDSVVAPGKAFFLIVRQSNVAVAVGRGKLVLANRMATDGIPLVAGWNFVGNPFPFDLSIDSLEVTGGATIQTRAYYSGSGGTSGWDVNGGGANTLRAWQGLALKVSQATSLRFRTGISTSAFESTSPPLSVSFDDKHTSLAEDEWLLRIDAYRTDNSMNDVGNLIGMMRNADDGLDAYDWHQPPLIGDKNVALYFRNENNSLIRDIRSVREDGHVWEMRVVTGDVGALVRLTFDGVHFLPAHFSKVYLIDLDQNIAHNLRDVRSIELNSGNGRREFRLLVGTREFVEQHRAGVNLTPESFKLFANYPNPFNPQTMIRFTLPEGEQTYHVTLKIYNVLGQDVKTLVEREYNAGYYEISFDARGLPSGVYFYRVNVSASDGRTLFNDVKRMILVR